MFCRNCGKEILDTSSVCTRCGSLLMDNMQIAKCPRCGGVQLSSTYDSKRDNDDMRKILLGGVFGLISVLRKSKAKACWVCQTCGFTFPME